MIVILAYWMRGWDVGIAAKLPVLIVAAFAVTALLYALLVRRVNGLRFLFGMRPLPRAPRAETVRGAAGT